MTTFQCTQCGAQLPIPEDLAVVKVRCTYCNTEQFLADYRERRRQLVEENAQAVQAVEAKRNVETGRRFLLFTVVGLPLLILGFIGLVFAVVGFGTFHLISRVNEAVPALGVPGAASDFGLVWDGRRPLVCTGHQNLHFENVTTVPIDGASVVATDQCHLTLTNCTVTGSVALNVSGNAHVVLAGGRYEGSAMAILAAQNADVQILGAAIQGRVQRVGLARVTGASP